MTKPSKYKWVKLRITEEHIAKGVPESSSHCPFALALRERFSPLTQVDGCHLYFPSVGSGPLLPRLARLWIREFDNCNPFMRPTAFMTQVPR